MMDFNKENERAFRIYFTIDSCHTALTDIYEKLVDREFDTVEKDIRGIISELRIIIKSIEEDDF